MQQAENAIQINHLVVLGGRCGPLSATIGRRGQGASPSDAGYFASGKRRSYRRPRPARQAHNARRAPLAVVLAACVAVVGFPRHLEAASSDFIGTWLQQGVSSADLLELSIDQSFVAHVPGYGSARLRTYGTGYGHPTTHGVAQATFRSGNTRTTLIFFLGTMARPGSSLNALQVLRLTSYGASDQFGNYETVATYARQSELDLLPIPLPSVR